MGDSEVLSPTANAPQPATESQENLNCETQKPSISILKEVKSSENIAIAENQSSSLAGDLENNKIEDKVDKPDTAANETKAEEIQDEPKKLSNKVDDNHQQELSNKQEETDVNVLKQKERHNFKHKSDIFSLENTDNLPSTIFSIGGAPSKTIHKTDSTNTNSSAGSNETVSSTTSKQSHLRNPLTGFGVSSNDEFKNKPSKRKDGNPLLGVGYKDDEEFFNSQPSQRIPPGGYSQGLW